METAKKTSIKVRSRENNKTASWIIGSSQQNNNQSRHREFSSWHPNQCNVSSLGIEAKKTYAFSTYFSKINPISSDLGAKLTLKNFMNAQPEKIKNLILKHNNPHNAIIEIIKEASEIWYNLVEPYISIEVFKEPLLYIPVNDDGVYESILIGTPLQSLDPFALPLKYGRKNHTSVFYQEVFKLISNLFKISHIHPQVEMAVECFREEGGLYSEDDTPFAEPDFYEQAEEEMFQIEKFFYTFYETKEKRAPKNDKKIQKIYQLLLELDDYTDFDKSVMLTSPFLEKSIGSAIIVDTMFFISKFNGSISEIVSEELDGCFSSDLIIPPMIFEPPDIALKTFPLRIKIIELLKKYFYE